MAKILTEDIIPALKQKIEEAGGGGTRAGNLPKIVVGSDSETVIDGWTRGEETLQPKFRYRNLDTGAQSTTTQATIPLATTTTAGVMSATDKAKLDSIPEGGGGGKVPKYVLGGKSDPYFPISNGATGGRYSHNISSPVMNTETGDSYNSWSMCTLYYAKPADSAVSEGDAYKAFTSSGYGGLMSGYDKYKLDNLPTITAIGEGLSLSEDGTLSGTGGGGGITPLAEYTATPSDTDVYSAGYVNSRLNGIKTAIGNSATSANRAVAVGDSARATLSSTIAVGDSTQATNNYAVAIGSSATASGFEAVALGSGSEASRSYEVSIGSGSMASDRGTRYLANVKDGELDQDAVTVHQLNEAVGNINTLLETLISGEGAK